MTTAADIGLEHEIGTTGLLAIRLHDGEARLRGVDGSVVQVRDRGGDIEGSFEIERGAGSLAVRAGRIGLFGESRPGGRSPDLDIEVPADATVVVETASGDIEVVGLRGDQRYRTASGDLTLRDVAGVLSADSVSGDVQILAIDRCAVTARTVSGDVSLRAATIETLRVSTTSGDVRIAGQLADPGPFAIESVSGDTTLAIAGAVHVELRTVAGDLRSDVQATAEGDAGRRTLTVGNGGPTVSVRSMSGDVRLIRPSAVLHKEAARMTDDAPTLVVATTPDPGAADVIEDARLAILRALERGEIGVAEATRRLEAVETDGPTEASAPGTPTDG